MSGAQINDPMLQRMAQLQELNLQIVQARKEGRDDEVQRLKRRVQDLLSTATKSTSVDRASAPSSTPSHTSSTSSVSRAPSPTQILQQSEIMKELADVNRAIAEARKAGDDMRVQRLKTRATRLMQMGIQSSL